MKIFKSKKIQLLILILSFNTVIFSELYQFNPYSNNGTTLLIDFSNFDNNNDNFAEEIDAITGLRRKILRWEEIVSQLSLTGMENRFSYQDESLVKIREDNKIEFIVKSEGSDFTPQQIEIFSKYGIEIYEELSSLNSSIIYIPLSFNGQSIYSFLNELIEIPGISYIEPNFYDQLAYVPDDFYYVTDQYDMPLIGMETAWNYQLGSSSVRVAVIDTGIDYNHPDLSANYLSLGYDWVNLDSDPMDDHNHGSHCAGTIAAVINNVMGVAGMAQVSIFAEKVLSASGSGSHANFKSGMIHAVDQGADIISYSAGGSDSTTKKEGVDYAINHGVMVIAAAGNSNTNTPYYPAAYPGVIAVSATDQSDLKASFSNYGTWIDVAAPGVDIISTCIGSNYMFMSGTSMACPHVAGLAALIKSGYPSYTSSQLENTIINNAVDLGTPGFDVYFGWGRISALNVFENPNAPNAPINPSPADGATGVSINPTLSVDVTDPNGDSMDVSFYDAFDDSLIGTDTGVVSGGTASVTWGSLSEGTMYSWYAVANDGSNSTISSTWTFTTNYAPDTIINPSPADVATGVSTSPTLSVDVSDPDGDSMDVSFYNASDDSLIGTDTGVVSGGTASVSWLGLSEGTTYSWYAVANDGSASTTSSTWSFTTNYAPDTIINPSPADVATGMSTSPTLSVDVSDPDGDSMDVSFYNASDDSLIGTDIGVVSGDNASVSWLGLSKGTTYSWYAVANDGSTSTTSPTWSFTTNYAPDTINNPSPADVATGVSTSPTLSVDVYDPDGDSMDVSFYNASDDSLIGTDTGVVSGGTASVSWLGLSESTTYSWYAVANDGSASTMSSTWSFTSFLDIPIWDQTPIDQILEFGEALLYDLNASDLSGIALYWINDTSNFNIDSNGVITNNGALAVGEYTVEIRAFDPYDNYCTAMITITVKDTPLPVVPGYNIIFLICTISIISLVVTRKQIKKKH